jgi:glycerol-3-phosphate dehydrogenase
MKRNPAELASGNYDVVVVGGGIFGAALTWEAASRGLSTVLLERGDFGEAASANSFKMVHGGIRYLQHGDIYRIRESCHERSSLLRTAPHIVRPLPIVVPTHRGLMRGRAAMRTALTVYDLVTMDRNRGISDPINHIPPGRIISRADCLDLFPALECPELTGAAVFHDGQMYNPTRLTLCFIRSAVEAGAHAANYMEVTGFLRNKDRIHGVTARDRQDGSELEVRGRTVINAAGGWAGGLLETLDGVRLRPRPTFSRDTCFVIPRRLIGEHALAIQGATKDPDAMLSRGARHLFLVPWRDYTLVGVWHVVYDGDPDRYTVTEEELERYLAEINGAVPSLGLKLDDISLWNAGLVLFGENRPGAKDLSYGKRSLIVDHAREDGLAGLITVIGVRYTTARGVAARAVDLAFRRMKRRPPRSTTASAPLYGGDFHTFAELKGRLRGRQGAELAEPVADALLRNYGSRFGAVLDQAADGAHAGQVVGRSTTLHAEVLHAVREEMALTLGDVVFRRTDLATGDYPGDRDLEACAGLIARELGWDGNRIDREISEVRARFLRSRVGGGSRTGGP